VFLICSFISACVLFGSGPLAAVSVVLTLPFLFITCDLENVMFCVYEQNDDDKSSTFDNTAELFNDVSRSYCLATIGIQIVSGGYSPQHLRGTAPWRARQGEHITYVGLWTKPQRNSGTVEPVGDQTPWSWNTFWTFYGLHKFAHFSTIWKRKEIKYLCYFCQKSRVATKLGWLEQNWRYVPPARA